MSAQRVPVVIDRSSPVPLYHQLAGQLIEAVSSGVLAPGDAFENELALAERLQLSRPTVRRAIQELVDLGLLVRRRGIGTTVASRKVHRLVKLSSLWDDLEASGRSPVTTVLDFAECLDVRAATELELPGDTPMVRIERVRSAGETPLAVMVNWVPKGLIDFGAADLADHGLYRLLRDRGIRPVVAQQSIGARLATDAECRHLGMRAGEPVLTMTRSAFDAAGAPVEFGDHRYRAADYTIELMVEER